MGGLATFRGLLLSGDRYFQDLLKAIIFWRYSLGGATVRGSLLLEVCGSCLFCMYYTCWMIN